MERKGVQVKMPTSYGVVKQRVKHISYEEYQVLKELTYASKNLYNKSLYIKRQDFFSIQAIRKSINRSKLSKESKAALLKRKDLRLLNYNQLYHIVKNEPEYKVLNANMSQQIIKLVDRNFKSFFGLLQAKSAKSYKEKVKLPNYLKKDSHFSLIVAEFSLKNNVFTLPMRQSYKNKRKISFKLPPILNGKTVKEIRVIPKQNARFFELQYVYEKEASNGIYNKNNALAIDLGVNNLMSCATNDGKAFIIDGKKIKSINQYANKENARLKSILDKQNLKLSKKLAKLWDKRNNKVNDYILKSCRYVVEFCKAKDIGNIILGYNKNVARNSNLGKRNNQNFVNIPLGKIEQTLSYMCKDAGIDFHLQEESYTSRASFFDNDNIPTYKDKNESKYIFSGKRVKRGLYKTSTGTLVNADINAALNILKKSNVVSLKALYLRGVVDTPQRIRLT